MKRISFLFSLLGIGLFAHAQFILSGKVTDPDGSILIGANIQIDHTRLGSVTDASGMYRFTNLEPGTYKISATYVGYEKQSQQLEIRQDQQLNFILGKQAFMTEEVIVSATRKSEDTPGTTAQVSKEQIQNDNLGQDIPYLLSLTPSLVTTSDAGAGVGYTGLRIRGTDANRINVTVNGIPLNDAESHGVFWVNMPDFSGSIENIQVQRGVGTSTNGAAAFGASINMQTNNLNHDAYAEISSSAGSFNTIKNTVKTGTGLLNNHFAFDARLSKITSDGFVDRASSDLKSFYLSGGFFTENTLVKVNIFSGKEKTYQAWWGVPKVRLENDTAGMLRYEEHGLYTHEQTVHMLESNPRIYNYYTYPNETDNYQQDHYQLFFSQNLRSGLTFNSALHYTYGRGYYEQYRTQDAFADYQLPDIILNSDTITSTDLVRQKWLDNDFYGFTASLNHKTSSLEASLGGAWNRYDGRHFGKIIWGQYLGNIEKDYQWYHSTGTKTDYQMYAKANYSISPNLHAYVDFQYRHIEHNINGIEDDFRDITQTHSFSFFNPKTGLYFSQGNHSAYLLYAVGHREPNRSNFTDVTPGTPTPKAEMLNDIELGYAFKTDLYHFSVNVYDMIYKDQLILTGEINNVGSAIMTNVDKSFRRGVELAGGFHIADNFAWELNATLSQNLIRGFTEYVDNWDTGEQIQNNLGETQIAFSPNSILNNQLRYSPVQGLDIDFILQYVGKQYIDNSESNDRMLNAYFVNNLRLSYRMSPRFIKELTFSLLINNLFNVKYETNAWVYSYYLGGERFAMDGYFPQAGTNFMTGVILKF